MQVRKLGRLVAAALLLAEAAPAIQAAPFGQEDTPVRDRPGDLSGFGSTNGNTVHVGPPSTPRSPGTSGTALEAGEDELIVYAARAESAIDWSSPRRMVLEYGFQSRKRRLLRERFGIETSGLTMGHMFVEFRSGEQHELVGMSTPGYQEEQDQVKVHGYGLGGLLTSLAGKFDDPAGLRGLIDEGVQRGKLAYMRFRLSPAIASRVGRYLREYRALWQDRRYSPDGKPRYGGANRPRYKEGAGCANFAVSVLEVAGLWNDRMAAGFQIDRRIPRNLVGGPLTGNRIQLTSLSGIVRLLIHDRWAREGEPHVEGRFWDPSKAHDWIAEVLNAFGLFGEGSWSTEVRGQAKGVVFDARERAAPSDPIWLGEPAWEASHPRGRQRPSWGVDWEGILQNVFGAPRP